MGFWSRMLGIDSYDAAQRVLADPYEPYMATAGIPVMDPGTPLALLYANQKTQVDAFWREQPNLRKVVDFIARAVASIPLHTYERVSDTERLRVTNHPLPDLLGAPRPRIGPYRFWHAVLSDGLLYDRWLVLKMVERGTGRNYLQHVPSWRTRFITDELRNVVAIKYWVGDASSVDATADESWVDIPLENAIYDYGYAPHTAGLSPVHTLSPVLREVADAIAYRESVWGKQAQAPKYVHRPADAPEWEQADRNRFAEGLRTYRQGGANAGGWPLLEDGMEIRDLSQLKSSEMLDLEGRELGAIEVATSYHVAPELLGIRPGNFSNMRELRNMLYRDALGPYIDPWVQAINAQLTPELAGTRRLYVEPHLDAKLRGSFEEQALIAQATVGAPVMTRNEYRARNNLPPIEGGDELITPLNVITGGLASPRDTGSQNRVPNPQEERAAEPAKKAAQKPALKAAGGLTEDELETMRRQLKRFLDRQGASVLSRLGAGEEWWDGERWDRELADVFMSIHMLGASAAGRRQLEKLGIDPDDYDEPRTINYLRRSSELSATSMNAHTRAEVEAASSDEERDPATVFGDGRVEIAATTAAAFAAGFGATEAARQQSPGATKTWRVNSGNPRPSHAAMDGETVGLDEDFSNGLPWPGAAGADSDESAGCQCSVEINIP